MNQDSIFNKPEFARLPDPKKEFIRTVLMHSKFTSPNDGMKAFMEIMTQAKMRNIQFTKEESSLLIEALMSSMNDDGKRKANKILSMMRFR